MMLLQALVQSNGRLLSRQWLIEHIWKGNFYTGKKGLTHSVCLLRGILDLDEKQSVKIITVPKRGYRLEIRIQSNSPHKPNNKINGVKL